MSDSGGLDARSLQDMREHAETWHRWADSKEEQQLAANVLVLLDERERLEARLRSAEDARSQFLAAWREASVSWSSGPHDDLGDAVARLAEGERASLDSPEAQQ